jgi:hypothetical protein
MIVFKFEKEGFMGANRCLALTLLLLSFFTLGVKSALADADKHKWGKITPEEWSLTPPAAFPEAAAVVIFDVGNLEVPQPYDGNRIVFERHVRIKIFDKSAADDAVSIEISIYGSEDLRGFDGATILPDGREFEFGKSALLKKKSGKNAIFYTFTFPSVEDGCIVEYKYRVWHDHYGALDPWYFQGPLYTLESSYTTSLAPGLNYTAITRNVPFELRSPVKHETGIDPSSPAEFTWTLRDTYPIEPEAYMTAVNSYYASVCLQLKSFKDLDNYVKFISDWPSLADVIEEEYTKPALDNDNGVRDQALELAAGLTDSLEIVRRICEYVRLEILTADSPDAYFLNTKAIDKVLADRLGSGTGKNLLMLQMLRELGFVANPVLIGSRSHSYFNRDIYDLNQFDYLICQVNTGGVSRLLDVSDRWVPFPYLPSEAMVPGGLLLDGKNSAPIQLQAPERRSSITVATRMGVDVGGSATCSTHVNLQGHFMSNHQRLLDAATDADDIKESLLEGQAVDFQLLDYQMTEYPGEDSAGIDMVFTLPDYCEILDSNLVVEPLLFALKQNPFKNAKRSFPVDFGFTQQISETVDITVNDSLTLATLPEKSSLAIDGLRYSQLVLGGGTQAKIISQLIVGKSIFTPAEYARLRETYDKITTATTDRVVAKRL